MGHEVARRSRDEVLVRLLAAATATFDSDRDRAKACVQQAAELLRVSLEREGYQWNESSSRGGLAPWQAKRAVAYIESNINRSFRVADLAGIVQLSISQFFRAFRESFGQSPLAYVNVRRMRHAQVIMLNTRAPLSQVALDCGMCDQAHFTRVFRKVVGISPSVWRRLFQSGDGRPLRPHPRPLARESQQARNRRWLPPSAVIVRTRSSP